MGFLEQAAAELAKASKKIDGAYFDTPTQAVAARRQVADGYALLESVRLGHSVPQGAGQYDPAFADRLANGAYDRT
jgi:hypothetical protein